MEKTKFLIWSAAFLTLTSVAWPDNVQPIVPSSGVVYGSAYRRLTSDTTNFWWDATAKELHLSSMTITGNLQDLNLAISNPLHLDASGFFTSGPINLQSDVGGTLPVLNGGTGGSSINTCDGASNALTWTGSAFGCNTLSGGGGGGNPLAVNFNGAQVSSPTYVLNIVSPLTASLIAGGTAQIGVDGSSVTLQGNQFNGTSQLVLTTGSGSLPALSGANLTSLTPANISAGFLPSNVVVSSLAVNSVYPAAVSAGTYGNITGVGTLTAGTWNASTLLYGYGGTGQTSAPNNDLLLGSGSAWNLSTLPSCSGGDSALMFNTGSNSFGCNTISTYTIYPATSTILAPQGIVLQPTTTVNGSTLKVFGDTGGNDIARFVTQGAAYGAKIDGSGALWLGATGSATGYLNLSNGNTSGSYVTLQNSTATTHYNFNFPTTAGSSGQVLTSAGGGTAPMYWSTGGSGGGGIVSPGTFTWTNTYGIGVSTLVATSQLISSSETTGGFFGGGPLDLINSNFGDAQFYIPIVFGSAIGTNVFEMGYESSLDGVGGGFFWGAYPTIYARLDAALSDNKFVTTGANQDLTSYDLFGGTQTWTGTNTLSSTTVRGALNVPGNAGNTANLYLGPQASISYGQPTPAYPLDFETGSGFGLADIAYIAGTSNNATGLACEVAGTAPSVYASNSGNGYGGEFIATNSTGVVATSVNGIAGYFDTTASTAVLVDKGSLYVSAPQGLTAKYGVTVGTFTGAGLSTCGDSSHALGWSAGTFSCQSISGGGGASLSSTNTWTAAQTFQAASDTTPVTINGLAVQSSDIFDVDKAGSKEFWIDGSGNMNFAGYNLQIGSNMQSNASYLKVIGGTSPVTTPYLWWQSVDGSTNVYEGVSMSTYPVVYISTSIPDTNGQTRYQLVTSTYPIPSGDYLKAGNGFTAVDGGSGGGGGSSAWSSLTAPSGGLSLNMSVYPSTFSWSDPDLYFTNWDSSGDFTVGTTSAATGSGNSSPNLNLCGQAYNGSGSVQDCWTAQVLYTGPSTNPNSVLTYTHTGDSGNQYVNFPAGTALSIGGSGVFTAGTVQSNNLASSSGNPISVKVPLEIEHAANPQFLALYLKNNSGATITAGKLVCLDSSNADSVLTCPTTTTDQFVGFAQDTVTSGNQEDVAIKGEVTNATLGTGSCAIGNWVIADTTTAGDVQCSGSAPSAGDQIGWALTADSSVGTSFHVLIDMR